MVLLWFLACAASGEEDSSDEALCEPGPRPTLEIGTGEQAFSPLSSGGGTLELVYGPQGGVHAVLALRARGLDDTSPVVTRIVSEVDGEILADVVPYLSFRCVGPNGAQEVSGAILVYSTPDLDRLVGQEATIIATATDAAGSVAYATARALMVNGEAAAD